MTKILVIDDNEDVRDTLVTILEDAGYQIAIARDGEEGVKQFAAERPELVITDIFMPKQEGTKPSAKFSCYVRRRASSPCPAA